MQPTPDHALPWPAQARHQTGSFTEARPLAGFVVLRRLWWWTAVLALPCAAWDAALMQAAAQRLGAHALAAVAPLQALLGSAHGMTDAERLRTVNNFYNQRIGWRTDAEIWGVDDYWATPLETLEKGQGDCEDFAIAKYASLLAAGMAPERLRLVYVRAQMPNQAAAQAHMVLAYYGELGAEPLILDNLRTDVLPASRRPDLAPVFSFNAAGLWVGTGEQRAGDPLVRLSRWREVWAKTRDEGFP